MSVPPPFLGWPYSTDDTIIGLRDFIIIKPPTFAYAAYWRVGIKLIDVEYIIFHAPPLTSILENGRDNSPHIT